MIIENKHYSLINYNTEQSELLSHPDEKRREAKECLRELGKMYGALKAKVKKFEKKSILLNEEKDKFLIRFINYNVQLALNKFISIDKNMRLCKTRINQLEKEYKTHSVYSLQFSGNITHRINETSLYYNDFGNLIHIAEDQIRIANKHLKKIDDYFAFMRKCNRSVERLRLQRISAPIAEPANGELK